MSSLQQLYQSWKEGVITPADKEALLRELALPENEEAALVIFREMLEQPEHTENEPVLSRERIGLIAGSIISVTAPVRGIHAIRRWGWAAAVLTLLVSTAAYFLLKPSPAKPVMVAVADIAPGSNKAVLTLADGSEMLLDSAGNRTIQQGGTAIKQTGGNLQYNATGNEAAGSYNTLTTPRGGQFRVTLPDGTKVWLNAASSLRYPTAFTGNERNVSITGEAYFEVAKNEEMPFRVAINATNTIEVLGTSFNVNAYTDGNYISTTLLTGLVRVRSGNGQAVLKPGQQAHATAAQPFVRVLEHADISKAIAWKNGLFNFQDADLKEVMQQLSRWYDIEVVYEHGIPDLQFIGEIDRSMPLSEVLKGLQMSGVNFRVEEGRRLVVYP